MYIPYFKICMHKLFTEQQLKEYINILMIDYKWFFGKLFTMIIFKNYFKDK